MNLAFVFISRNISRMTTSTLYLKGLRQAEFKGKQAMKAL